MGGIVRLTSDQYTGPTRNHRLNALLSDVRRRTGEDWRIAERRFCLRQFLRRPTELVAYELYVETGAGEFKVVSFYRANGWTTNYVGTAEHVATYLEGVLAGLDRHAQVARRRMRAVK